MSKTYPENILKLVRQQKFDLEEDDISRDLEINSLPSTEIFESVLEWEGICGYGYQMIKWIKDIYGVDLNNIK